MKVYKVLSRVHGKLYSTNINSSFKDVSKLCVEYSTEVKNYGNCFEGVESRLFAFNNLESAIDYCYNIPCGEIWMCECSNVSRIVSPILFKSYYNVLQSAINMWKSYNKQRKNHKKFKQNKVDIQEFEGLVTCDYLKLINRIILN